MTIVYLIFVLCALAKAGDIQTHSFTYLFIIRLLVTKTLTWLISSEVCYCDRTLILGMHCPCDKPFNWHHALILIFDLLQGQTCCCAGDHNSQNFLITFLCTDCCFIYHTNKMSVHLSVASSLLHYLEYRHPFILLYQELACISMFMCNPREQKYPFHYMETAITTYLQSCK